MKVTLAPEIRPTLAIELGAKRPAKILTFLYRFLIEISQELCVSFVRLKHDLDLVNVL